MLKYQVEKEILPVMPGDYVYYISSDQAHIVRAIRVDSVVLGLKNRLTVRVENKYGDSEIGKDVYLTAEEAEAIAAKDRPAPPYFYSDRAVMWMPIETWTPVRDGFYGVKIAKKDGSFEHIVAYYDDGEKYEDERGYYESDRRNARRIENVVAWIDPDYIKSDEWYDGKPLDFGFHPIEELDLQVRTYNVLKASGIHVIRDLLRLPDRSSLEKIRNMGKKSYEEVIQRLEDSGFKVDYLK